MTFDVGGVRFGCALGMETHYPEIFTEYERLDVDCVLFSTTGETPSAASGFAAEVLGHAASNTYWISYAAHAPQSIVAPSGIAAPNGQWKALCTADGGAAITVADIVIDPESRSTVAAKGACPTLRSSSGGKRPEERHSQSVLKTLCGQRNTRH